MRDRSNLRYIEIIQKVDVDIQVLSLWNELFICVAFDKEDNLIESTTSKSKEEALTLLDVKLRNHRVGISE